MSLSARRACVCLLFCTGLAAAVSTSANSISATMHIGVTVVRSCSVSTAATGAASPVDVTVECRKGSADVVSVGVVGQAPPTIQRVLPGANQISVPSSTPPVGTDGTLTVTIEF